MTSGLGIAGFHDGDGERLAIGGGQGGLPARTLSTLGSRAIITIYLRTQYNNYYLC